MEINIINQNKLKSFIKQEMEKELSKFRKNIDMVWPYVSAMRDEITVLKEQIKELKNG